MAFERAPELVPRIAAIGENMAQPWEAIADRFEDIDGPVAVLNIGGMNQDEDQIAAGVSNDMPFAAFDLLARVIVQTPPLSVVLTLWLSMTSPLGEASRPSISRRFIINTMLIASNKLVSRQE